MTGRRQSERLRLDVLVGMQASLDFAIHDNDDGQDEAEERGTHSNHTREADRLEHDVAEAGNLVRLDDFHYDWRAWRLHRTIVQQA
jgi:hypothetical protein